MDGQNGRRAGSPCGTIAHPSIDKRKLKGLAGPGPGVAAGPYEAAPIHERVYLTKDGEGWPVVSSDPGHVPGGFGAMPVLSGLRLTEDRPLSDASTSDQLVEAAGERGLHPAAGAASYEPACRCPGLAKEDPMKDLLASSPHLAVIPAPTALTVRYFKHKQGQDDGSAELEPKHPAVKFVLGAWIRTALAHRPGHGRAGPSRCQTPAGRNTTSRPSGRKSTTEQSQKT